MLRDPTIDSDEAMQVSYQLHLVLAKELASDTCVKKSQDSKTMHELNRTQATIQGLKVKYTPIVIELYDRQAAFDAGRLPRQALEQAQA
ncbi:unnamed protein product, partial [Aphanomyces euteiches]